MSREVDEKNIGIIRKTQTKSEKVQKKLFA